MNSGAANEDATAPLHRESAPGSMLDAWRERGDHRHDPVRFRFIEALARRAATHRGAARRILDDRLIELLAAYAEDLATAPAANATESPQGPPAPGALAGLVEHLARHAASPGVSSALDLKTLKYFRSTWSRLSANRRLTQSLATMPENAGPLNSHHLVHRSLTVMRELSPEYLHRFMAYADALLWVDQANSAAIQPSPDSPRPSSPKKTARKKSA